MIPQLTVSGKENHVNGNNMAYLTPAELESVIYQYQLTQITEGDLGIQNDAINAAIQEVSSYLNPNMQHQYQDGRPLYDVEAIFAATGDDRNALVLMHTKIVSVYYIMSLANVDIIHEDFMKRYDRTISYLKDVRDGKMNIHALPVRDPETDEIAGKLPMRKGSREKFNHE